MSKPIVMTEPQWYKLKERLANDYRPGILLLSYRMKEVLGFTVREHREWSERKGYKDDIRLDFYSEPKRTMFLLKYSEYLDKTGITDS
jgi:hypothetical protein